MANDSDHRPSEFARPEHPGDLTPYLKHLLDGGTLPEEASRAAFEAMVAALGSLHDEVAVLVDETITHASRLAPFGSRFRRAVEAVTAEDVTMLASPLKDSYHTVWFEYHEELIHLSGRNRADEEAAT